MVVDAVEVEEEGVMVEGEGVDDNLNDDLDVSSGTRKLGTFGRGGEDDDDCFRLDVDIGGGGADAFFGEGGC
jgi:hypothetical protein